MVPDRDGHVGGFRGGTFFGNPYNPSCTPIETHADDVGHLAMTYTALASLAILGDPMDRVDRAAIARSLQELQVPSGCFVSSRLGGETDMRFMYCACCVAHLLGDWSGVDVPRARAFILGSRTYEGAFAQGPGLEAHAGSTFCAIASLKMMVGIGRNRHRLPRPADALPARAPRVSWRTR